MNHTVIDDRSLAFHRCIAEKLRANPSLLSVAKTNLERWLDQDPGNSVHAFKEWQRILRQPLEKILAILTADTDRGRRLRQSTPFSGILSPKERTKISRQYETVCSRTYH